MCGICGELSFGGVVDPEILKRMTDKLIHRGPDDSGYYLEGSIGLGHRRLSILDLSASGHQPMCTADRFKVIVYNGEIYNFREIRPDLEAKGYRFQSGTDTEVVLNAIHCWGIEKALSKFIGMFAFAVWNKEERELILCRDRSGIKPLYYYVTDRVFLFGSELKSLLQHPEFKKELNAVALGQHFVTGYFLNHHTVFKGVYKLQPGHYLTIKADGAMQLRQYWGLDTIRRGSFDGSFDEAQSRLEDLLESAFSYRLVADVPVGLFLSGGIDSSLVSAVLRKKTNADILNITIGFQEKNFDEAPKANRVSEELGVRQITHYVSSSEAEECLFRFCDIYDEPFGDTSGIPTYILSRLAREHVKVALSADGGDEQFCGYESYASYAGQARLLLRIPRFFRMFASILLGNLVPYRRLLIWGGNRRTELTYAPQRVARYEKLLRLIKVADQPDLLRLMNEKAWSEETVISFLSLNGSNIFEDTPLSRDYLSQYRDGLMDAMMRTDYETFLRDDILTKVDRASMHVSLECRDPFLDHRIAEFAFSLPIDYLFFRGEHKRILKSILRQWISEEIIRSPKRGFMIPLYHWLRGVWKPTVLEYLSRDRIRAVGFLDERKVEAEVKQFYKYNGGRAEKIWMMLNFQMWAEKWYLN